MNDTPDSKFFQYTNNTNMGEIDNISWNDIYGDEVFNKVDRCKTSPGKAILYSILRHPLNNSKEVEKREKRILQLKDSAEIQKVLTKIGVQNRCNLADEIWDPNNYSLDKYKLPLIMWMLFTISIVVSAFFIMNIAVLIIVLSVLTINILIYSKVKMIINAHNDSISYLIKMIFSLPKLLKKSRAILSDEEFKTMQKVYNSLKIVGYHYFILANKGSNITSDMIDVFKDFYRIFFLIEIYSFVAVYNRFNSHSDEIKALYKFIGELDAHCSMAELRDEYKNEVSVPTLTDDLSIEMSQMKNPLIDNCKKNNLSTNKSIILTGSNMSGKSTFLRTIAINQLLAQSINLVFASSWRSTFFQIMSSISNQDNMLKGESRYFTEARRLKDALQITDCQGSFPCLLLVDEILSGTNNRERMIAAKAILRKLSENDVLTIAATHDLEIADDLAGIYDNYHFSEKIRDDKLFFDYQLKKGIIYEGNAIKLLKYIGFSEDLLLSLEQ